MGLDKFDRAINGLSDDDHDVLKTLLRSRDYARFKQWHELSGSFRAYELYRSAELAYDDERFVRYVLDHYDASQDQLDEALRRAVRGVVECDFAETDGPLSAAHELIDAGADPEQTDPTLIETYLKNAYQSRDRLESFVQGFEAINELSARPQTLDDLRDFYEPDKLPRYEPHTAKALRPLIRYGAYPTQEQLSTLQNQKPELYDELLQELPDRKQKAERVRQS